MDNFITQLKQRQVFKVATIYAVSAWPLIQIADLSVPALGLPDSVMTLLLQIFIAGFPLCLIFAWLFNITAKGIVRASADAEDDNRAPVNVKTTITVAGPLLLVMVFTLGSQLAMEEQKPSNSSIGASVTGDPVGDVLAGLAGHKESIAVLPFVPFSNDQEDEFFADGMVEELLNLLARIPELRVAARTSSFAYKGVSNKTIPQIGRELGVGTILEGSIRKNDTTNKIRVTAQLIKVSTGEHLWSETYDREYRDIFQIQDDIARAVVKKMQITLLGDEQKPAFTAQTNSVDAMVAFGKGQQELSHRTPASLAKALQHFKQAIKLDGNYARAWVGIADANNLLPLYGTLPLEETRLNAREAIDQALAIDDQLGEAYAAQGLWLAKSDMVKAQDSYRRAITLSPSYAMTYMWYAVLLKLEGKMEAARELYEKAFELDPKSPVAANNVASLYYGAGDEDKAMELFSYIIANDPYYPGAYNLVGRILLERGRLEQSIDMFKRALSVDADNKEAVKGLLTATMDMGSLEAADGWFDYAGQRNELLDETVLNLLKAQYHVIKGDSSQAIQFMEKIDVDYGPKGMGDFIEGHKAYYLKDYALVVSAFERIRQQGNGEFFYYAGDADAPVHLAYAYQRLDEAEKANEVISAFEQYLEKNKAQKVNNAGYYYQMALVKALQHKGDDALYYLQGAINVGWVRAWQAEIEPIFEQIIQGTQSAQFGQMMGGVRARLTTMRNRLESADDEFLLVEDF